MNKIRRFFLLYSASFLSFPTVVSGSLSKLTVNSPFPVLNSLSTSVLTKKYENILNLKAFKLQEESINGFLIRKEKEAMTFFNGNREVGSHELYKKINAHEFRSGKIINIYNTHFSEVDFALLLLSK